MASPWDNVDANFAANLQAMIAESGGRITVVSGYRSPERQAQLYGEALRRYGSEQEARKRVAPPGKSNHNKGVAFDLGGDLQLAHTLAPKYGLAFPMGHEPWHIEPSGVRDSSDPAAYTTDPSAPTEQDQTTDGVFATIGELLGEKLFSSLGEQSGSSILNGGSTTSLGEGVTPSMGATTPPKKTSTTGATTSSTTGATTSTTGGAAGGVDAFMRAIGGQESGGNYDATNATSGAHGKFQIMPANWPSWSREAGLGENAAQTPENQEKVARFKMQQYYDQFGSWDKVAKAWYSGPGNVDKNVSGGPGYPDSDTYAKEIAGRMGGN
jgi:hypothetical protein